MKLLKLKVSVFFLVLDSIFSQRFLKKNEIFSHKFSDAFSEETAFLDTQWCSFWVTLAL